MKRWENPELKNLGIENTLCEHEEDVLINTISEEERKFNYTWCEEHKKWIKNSEWQNHLNSCHNKPGLS